MILVKAPLRISFFGGGSDLPSFYNQEQGHVLSTTIDKYMYVAINTNDSDLIKLMYSEIEIVDHYDKLKHDIVRHSLQSYGKKYQKGIEIASFADIPTVGTGLGSSSTFAVALIEGLNVLNKMHYSKETIAHMACNIEINKCGSPIGRQDQYAAAYGGFNHFTFNANDKVNTEPVNASTFHTMALNEKLLLFYTGIQRSANDILKRQQQDLNVNQIKEMSFQAQTGLEFLKIGNLDCFGEELDIAWRFKRSLVEGITNPFIDDVYSEGIRLGALGGKILGAGGGGYMLFYVPEELDRFKIIARMSSMGLKYVPFKFEDRGVEVVYDDNR